MNLRRNRRQPGTAYLLRDRAARGGGSDFPRIDGLGGGGQGTLLPRLRIVAPFVA